MHHVRAHVHRQSRLIQKNSISGLFPLEPSPPQTMIARRSIASTLRCVVPATSSRAISSTSSIAAPAISSLQKPDAPSVYPFSSTARAVPSVPTPPKMTNSLMRTLNAHLTSLHPSAASYLELFSRRHKNRLLPGSVLTVSSYASLPTPENPTPATTTFSGVLIAMRRRHAGRDTSFRLRNLVGRTGVEVAFKLFSPMIASIKIVARAATSGTPVLNSAGVEVSRRKPVLLASRRAKMFFVRDQPSRLTNVGSVVKQAKEKEMLAEKKRR